jgi:hypothetical protein
MVHFSGSPGGALAIGIGAFGSSVWIQRETVCHRWRVWHTRTPRAGITCGDDEGFGSAGVREPRRPLPGSLGGTGGIDLTAEPPADAG